MSKQANRAGKINTKRYAVRLSQGPASAVAAGNADGVRGRQPLARRPESTITIFYWYCLRCHCLGSAFENSEIQHLPPDYLKCRSKMQKPNRDGWAKTKSSSVAYKGNDKKPCFNGQGFSGQ